MAQPSGRIESSGIFKITSGSASTDVLAKTSLPWSRTSPRSSDERCGLICRRSSQSGDRLAIAGITTKL
jgi:hypothetical protein